MTVARLIYRRQRRHRDKHLRLDFSKIHLVLPKCCGTVITVTLIFDEDLVQATRLTEQQILQELAVALFQGDHLTLAQAARLGRTDRLGFQHLLASRGVPLHYGDAGYEEDLKTLSKLGSA